MLQVFFLVIEGVSVKVGERTILMEPGDVPEDESLPQSEPLATSIPKRFESIRRRFRRTRSYSETAQTSEDGSTERINLPSPWPAYVAAGLSASLFIAIVILQILGLRETFSQRGLTDVPPATWCSPMFQPFRIAMVDGDCNMYAVERRHKQGIGCVTLPGMWQREWQWISAIGTLLCLFAEFADMTLLSLVDGKKKVSGVVKLKRPWSTMILGLVALCVTLFFGIEYANMLPPGITRRVLVAVDAGHIMVFEGRVVMSGLRGAIFGWSDGLFESWSTAYFES